MNRLIVPEAPYGNAVFMTMRYDRTRILFMQQGTSWLTRCARVW